MELGESHRAWMLRQKAPKLPFETAQCASADEIEEILSAVRKLNVEFWN